MAAERLSMRKTKEVLRLKAAGQSNRAIARSLGIARSTVAEYLRRAEAAGISWPLPPGWTDAQLQGLLFPLPRPSSIARPLPDWAEVHRELKARKRTGVTLQLLWVEYKEREPDGLQYSQFCELYRRWRGRLDLVLRQEHVPGEKVFVDFAGQTVPVVNRTTGEIRAAEIFVGVLGASNFTYAEACWSQELPQWVGAHVRMFAYFGGVMRLIVPDNLRTGVKHACYYEPDLNPFSSARSPSARTAASRGSCKWPSSACRPCPRTSTSAALAASSAASSSGWPAASGSATTRTC